MPFAKAVVLAIGGFAVVGSALVQPALAQSNPSADSIINSLRPGPGMMGSTRGIRQLPQGATTAPATTPATAGPRAAGAGRTAPPAATATAAPSVNLTVQFATNSADLTPAATHTLDELGRALSSDTLSTFHFRIEGHTDTVGNPDHNQVLSEQRAKTVVDYLVSKFGIDRARLEPVGMGEMHLLVRTGQNVAEPRNRRVTVVNTGA